MIIKTLQKIDFSVIHKAFSKAFVDYELPPMSLVQLKQMLTRRGYNPEISFGAFSNNILVGYGITELNTGDITQFAINENFRRKGIAMDLLYQLIGCIPGDTVKIINTDRKDVSMKIFLESINIQAAGSQFEMIKAL